MNGGASTFKCIKQSACQLYQNFFYKRPREKVVWIKKFETFYWESFVYSLRREFAKRSDAILEEDDGQEEKALGGP